MVLSADIYEICGYKHFFSQVWPQMAQMAADKEVVEPRDRVGHGPSAGGVAVTRISDLHSEWMTDPAYQAEYNALDEKFALASALIRARASAGLTQEQLAERMGTKQEVVARWQGGKVLPSTRTLARLAKATGTRLRISFAPAGGDGTARCARRAKAA